MTGLKTINELDKTGLWFPNLALILLFTQMAWLGIFHLQSFLTTMPRRNNSLEKMVSLGIQTHISRVAPGPRTFEGHFTD